MSLKDKHKDLQSSQQKKLLQQLLEKLTEQHPDFYYLSTTEIAAELHSMAEQGSNLSAEQKQLLKGLSQHDIQILLSLH